MAKTAEKFADTIESASFDPSKATDQFRGFAEKTMEQSKEAYAKMKTGAEEAQKVAETTMEHARTATTDVSLKMISAMRANTEASFSHLEALLGVKSVSEFVELQTSFLRKRVEMMVEQTKELQAASSKAAEDMSLPVRNAFEKSVKELKVA